MTNRYVQLTTRTEFLRKQRRGLINSVSPKDLRPVDYVTYPWPRGILG
jgi:hypothetical protein